MRLCARSCDGLASPPRILQVYFAVSGLDVLGSLKAITNRDAIVNWIYSLQVVSFSRRRDVAEALGDESTPEYALPPFQKAILGAVLQVSSHHALATAIVYADFLVERSVAGRFRSIRCQHRRPVRSTPVILRALTPALHPWSSSVTHSHYMFGSSSNGMRQCVETRAGDDLSRVDKRGIIAALKTLQQPDGGFVPCRMLSK
jgi:hypothetical protein